MIRAGELRLRAVLQTRNEVEDPEDSGGKLITYTTHAVVWCKDASAEGKTGRELLEAQKVNSELSHAIQMRYRADVTVSMRLVIGDTVLSIAKVFDPDSRRKELTLLCAQELRQ